MKQLSYGLCAFLLFGLFLSSEVAATTFNYVDGSSGTLYTDERTIYGGTTAPADGDIIYLTSAIDDDEIIHFRYTSSTAPIFAALYVDNTNDGNYLLTLRSSSTVTDPYIKMRNGYIGYDGQGAIVQSRSSHVLVEDTMRIGYHSGSLGTYTLSIGTLAAVNDSFNLNVGEYGKGIFNQTGGTVEISTVSGHGSLRLGTSNGGEGIYNLSGGTLSNQRTGSYGTYLSAIGYGTGAEGTFNQSGGTHDLKGYLHVGVYGTGTYNLTGGSLDSESGLVLGFSNGGVGTFTQNGGNADFGISLYAGYAEGAEGTYTIRGSDDTFRVSYATLGLSGNGIFNQINGTVDIPDLYIGRSANGTGEYNMKGGTLDATSIYIGLDGTGEFNQEGGVVNASSAVCIKYTDSGTGTFNMSGGIFNATNQLHNYGIIDLDGGTLDATDGYNYGSANLDGGTLAGTMTNEGVFRAYSGRVTAEFTNNSNLYVYGYTGFSDDLLNNDYLSVSNGAELSMSGNLENNGQVLLNDGELYLHYRMRNYGLMTLTEGEIDGTGLLLNYGQITQGSGALTISNTGDLYNCGTMDLKSGYQTRLDAADIQNYAAVNLNGGFITGTGTVQNHVGGLISGPGIINAAFSNQGRLLVGAGNTAALDGIANTGQIQLTDDSAALTGGEIGNTGTIEGRGMVSNAVVNTGTIEAIGGTMTLGGAVTNSASGLMAAGTGTKILVSQGLTTNSGTINLTGGTFDNNNQAMANDGQISGHGIIRTGGLSNNSGGSVTLTGGNTTVNGDVNNYGTFTAAYNPVIFTGDVVNYGTFKNTETTVTFAGSYTENGTYISDPAVTYVQDLIMGSTGALIGGEVDGEYDKWYVANDFINNSTRNETWNTVDAFLGFTGVLDGEQDVYLAAEDMGATLSGYTDNFAWGYVDIEDTTFLNLFDGNISNIGMALYVEALTGISIFDGKVTNISGDGNIYYLADLAENAYLGGPEL